MAHIGSRFKAQVDDASPNNIAAKKTNFKFSPVANLTIKYLLNGINIQKACGFDQIPAKLIKLGASAVAQPLNLFSQ